MNNFYFPLKPPSDQAIEVFNKVLKGNANADMRAIPNQWLLNERGLSAKLGEEIGQLRDALGEWKQQYQDAHAEVGILNDEARELRQRIEQLETALRRLRNEASGSLYLSGVREAIGNTNFACIEQRIAETDQLLAGETGPDAD